MSLSWLNDKVYSIRMAAITNLKELTKLFGSQWAEKNVVPTLKTLLSEINYLHRLTVVFAISELASVVSADMVRRCLVPLLVQMSKDKIPNVRMNVSKSILAMRTLIKNNQTKSAEEQQVETELL